MNLAELVERVADEFVRRGENFSLKEVYDEAREQWKENGGDEDLIGKAIWSQVKSYDRNQRNDIQPTLSFGEFGFAGLLVTDENQRQPTPTAKLRHVLADLSIKRENFIKQTNAFGRREKAVLELEPYLQSGMNVKEAVDAWKADHQTLGTEAD